MPGRDPTTPAPPTPAIARRAGGASSTTSAAPAPPAGCSATTGWPSSTCPRTATSRSPVGEAGRWLIYNGEIYNYRELRAELEALGHEFVTETDTEVVAASYDEWGTGCFSRFNGMWALAVYDVDARRSFSRGIASASSRSTTTTVRTAFLFGSELKFLAGLIDLGLDETAAAEYLAESRIDHRPETLHPEVRQLPPGHLAEYDYADHDLRVEAYWRLDRRRPAGHAGAAPGGRGVHRAVRLRDRPADAERRARGQPPQRRPRQLGDSHEPSPPRGASLTTASTPSRRSTAKPLTASSPTSRPWRGRPTGCSLTSCWWSRTA